MSGADSVVKCQLLPAANGKAIAHAELNAPATLNSLSLEMVELLLPQLDAWAVDEQVSAVLITAAGDKAFCAGGDIQALYASAVKTPGGPCVEGETFFTQEYRLDYAIHQYPKPVIVWGDGIVMGGGLGILAGGSHRVVTETSRFAMPEVTIGLYPDVGGSYFLNRMPGQSGRFLALTGASFNAADALFTGVANLFITRDSYDQVVTALTQNAISDDASVSAALADIVDASKSSLPAGNVESHLEIIDQLCVAESTQQVFEAICGYQTEDKWMLKAQQGLAHGSPLSVLLIDEQLKRSRELSLAEVFKSEILLSTTIIRYPEFAEGVRALLIDKDKNPQWRYPDLSSVPGDVFEAFFVAPWDTNPLADLN